MIQIRNFKTGAHFVVATPKGKRKGAADTLREAIQVAGLAKEVLVHRHEPSFNPPWRPVARLLAGKLVPLAPLAAPDTS